MDCGSGERTRNTRDFIHNREEERNHDTGNSNRKSANSALNRESDGGRQGATAIMSDGGNGKGGGGGAVMETWRETLADTFIHVEI